MTGDGTPLAPVHNNNFAFQAVSEKGLEEDSI